jgi:hypothetical protein
MKMKTLSTLKTLPLIGLLAMGLTLAPVVSTADDGDRGRGKDRVYQKHDGGKGHYRDAGKSHRRDKGHYERGHKKGYAQGHNKAHKKAHKKGHKYVQSHNRGHGYKHHKHHGHTHNVYRPHHHGHGHVDHVIVHDYYSSYDPFRLMLGLHLDNIDIIYRDF